MNNKQKWYSIRLIGSCYNDDNYICWNWKSTSYHCRYQNALKYVSPEVARAAISVLKPLYTAEFPGTRNMQWIVGEYRPNPYEHS
jgi:hypothetical protein